MAVKNDYAKELNFIGAGTSIEGKIKSVGSIRIDGKMVGDVSASENLAVGISGEVEGTLAARNVTIGGKVRGLVTASEKLVFEAKAVVKGDIRAAKLVVDEGAIFDGKCVMTDAKAPLHDLKS